MHNNDLRKIKRTRKTKNQGKEPKNPLTILKTVQKEAKDGAILLFHDRLPTTVTALREVIPWLQAQGYDLVTVTELIESSGESIRYGEDYHRKPGR